MTEKTTIPETEWNEVQNLARKINNRMYDLGKDVRNLNNLLHALHGEGVRDREYTESGRPEVFQDGVWVRR